MRACGGVWVAHGSGDADEETADARGRLGLPTDDPAYTLRRVWLTKEEEEGYYYGFSNEGLWPLCHVVHARPLFRSGDWEQYRIVNAKFAEALLDEMEGQEAPMVLIQDYHLALLPGPGQGAAARRAGGHLLAHPVAELRVVRDLPLAAGDPARHAGGRHHRLSHPVPLQQFPGVAWTGRSRPASTASGSR